MARRADAKNVSLGAMETTPTAAAGAHSVPLPSGGSAGRGGAMGMPQLTPQQAAAVAASHHLPSSVSAMLLLLQGKLLRRDRTFLTWKWRDFYLEQHRLQYFSEKGVRKGEIVITKTTPIMIRLLSEPKPYGFLVFIQDEKLTLAAATAQDRQKWIDVFTEVFHANVEDFQSHKTSGGSGSSNSSGSGGPAVGANASTEKPEKKRTRPTFLPIPDISEDEGGTGQHYTGTAHHHLLGGGAKTPVGPIPQATLAAGTSTVGTTGVQGRTSLTRQTSEGLAADLPAGNPTTSTATPALANAPSDTGASGTAATNSLAAPQATTERRLLFRRNSDNVLGVDVSVPRSKFIALKEHYSSVTFPRSLGNGDVLVGVGPLVRRMGWTDERILAVGLYVDADAAAKEMHRFHGRNLKSLRGDQAFYDYLMYTSRFRRSFVVTSRKRVSKSVLIALLYDEIAPRISGSTEALHTFLSFIEKSLRKAESMMIRIHPDGGRLECRLRGQQYPPIASSMLCQCIQSVFFDVNSIQQDAKRRLVDRFPLLWGIEESEDALVAQGLSDHNLRAHELEPRHGGSVSESEDDDDEDEDDEEASERMRGVISGDDSARSRTLSIKEKLDEQDEREHELMRRESRTLGVHFGPIVDRDSNVLFRGDLLVDGSALLGTWSQQIIYMEDVDNTGEEEEEGEAADGLLERSCGVSVGLYAEPGGASEALLKYKGLSVGSILQDMDFFARFADGAFTKHLVFKVDASIAVAKLVDYFTARVRRRGSNIGTPGGDSGRSNDAKVRALFERLDDAHAGVLRPEDALQITIFSDSRMTLTVTRQLQEDGAEKQGYPRVDGIKIASAPFSTIFQGIFYGYHTLEPASRSQLMERLPSLLDLAKDDLAHTYHDEIQVLKENYKRQLPEFRLKAGYLLISFEKKKMAKNADGVKEETITASKWSKRWCRLDGTTFSYFSHKRSKKPRDILDLTHCTVSEITSTSTMELVPFAMEKGANPSIRIGIARRLNGEIIALRTESIYEGVEWLESLVEASRVVRQLAHLVSDEETERGVIETSGGGEADESSGALDEELDGDDGDSDEAHEHDDDKVLVERATPILNRSNSVASHHGGIPYKHGSLLSWIREDSRHATIFALLLLLTWFITSLDPTLFLRSTVMQGCEGDANSTLATSPASGATSN